MAQVPQAFSYQAVARDASGQCLVDQLISLRINFHDNAANGPLLYQEEFRNVQTNGQGLFHIRLGEGNPQNTGGGSTPNFENIDWKQGEKWLEVEMDPNNGFAFVSLGAEAFTAVPYALQAGNASAADRATQATNANNATRSIEAQYADTATFARNVVPEPVGTVKLFWDANGTLSIPDGWMVLDGSVVSDTASPLDGTTLPNMTNKYAVGKASNTGASTVGNRNHRVNLSHSHTVNPHTHTIPSHSHGPGSLRFKVGYTNSSNTTLYLYDRNGNAQIAITE